VVENQSTTKFGSIHLTMMPLQKALFLPMRSQVQMELYQIKTSRGRKGHEIVEHPGSQLGEVEEA
ncbi:uncharacterized protein METZ01_LOCUS72941, partial [marine metagenome]